MLWDKKEVDEKERDEIAELLYHEIELRHKNGRGKPTKQELVKIAYSTFNISLKDALSCVLRMQEKYKIELK